MQYFQIPRKNCDSVQVAYRFGPTLQPFVEILKSAKRLCHYHVCVAWCLLFKWQPQKNITVCSTYRLLNTLYLKHLYSRVKIHQWKEPRCTGMWLSCLLQASPDVSLINSLRSLSLIVKKGTVEVFLCVKMIPFHTIPSKSLLNRAREASEQPNKEVNIGIRFWAHL